MPLLLAPFGAFVADRLAPCRPTEQLPAASPAVHDLALLLPADAGAPRRQAVPRFRVQVAGGPDRRKIGDVHRDEYEVLPQYDTQGVLQLEPGPDVSGFVVVDATLRVIHHPRHVVGAVDVKAFTEYRFVDAARP